MECGRQGFLSKNRARIKLSKELSCGCKNVWHHCQPFALKKYLNISSDAKSAFLNANILVCSSDGILLTVLPNFTFCESFSKKIKNLTK